MKLLISVVFLHQSFLTSYRLIYLDIFEVFNFSVLIQDNDFRIPQTFLRSQYSFNIMSENKKIGSNPPRVNELSLLC